MTIALRRFTGFAVCGLSLIAAFASPSFAQLVVVKNDQLPDNLVGFNGTLGVVGAFNFNEEANVWLTTPCDGNIIEIQILWYSGGFSGQSVEQWLGLYEEGSCNPANGTLNRSVTALVQPGWGDVVLSGPVMTAGAAGTANVISFQHVDEAQTIPMSVPVLAGQTFVVSLTFGEDWCDNSCSPSCIQCDLFTGATIVHDALGCTPCRNGVFGPPTGQDLCNQGMSGNIIFRVIVQCSSGDGACCLPDGSCQIMTESECDVVLGAFQGIATDCAGANCTPPDGACCVGAQCISTTLDDCENTFGGTWLGPSVTCTPDPCGTATTGACCFVDGSCLELTQNDCVGQGGTYTSDGQTCELTDCPQPLGACCFDVTCFAQQLSEIDCTGIGGSWKGAGTDCEVDPIVCTPVGACCFANEACLDGLSEDGCLTAPGASWMGEGSICLGGTPDALCDTCPADCSPQPSGDGKVDVLDLLDLLAQWGGAGSCDFIPPGGDGTVDVLDLLALLAAWGDCP